MYVGEITQKRTWNPKKRFEHVLSITEDHTETNQKKKYFSWNFRILMWIFFNSLFFHHFFEPTGLHIGFTFKKNYRPHKIMLFDKIRQLKKYFWCWIFVWQNKWCKVNWPEGVKLSLGCYMGKSRFSRFSRSHIYTMPWVICTKLEY